MRSSLIAYTGVMSAFFMVLILSLITMKSSYYELIRQSLDDSLEYSISMIQLDRALNADSTGNTDVGLGQLSGGYRDISWSEDDSWLTASESKTDKEANDEYFKKRFVEYLTSMVDSKIDSLELEIYGADSEYGVISVQVTADFTYPFGKTDNVSVYKTMILNREIH